MEPEELLKHFYRAYWDWLQAGAPMGDEYIFKRYSGLCSNLLSWLTDRDAPSILYVTDQLMKNQFIADGLSNVYPFDNDTFIYKADQANNKLHLNPKRIAWVKKHMQ